MSFLDDLLGGVKNVAIGGAIIGTTGLAPTLNFVSGASGIYNATTHSYDITITGGGGGGGGVTWANDLATSSNTHQYVGAISGASGAGGTVPLHVQMLQYDAGQVLPTISQARALSDVATTNMVLAPQSAYASATGSNRTPGSLVVSLAAPVSGGSHAGLVVQESGTSFAQVAKAGTIAALWLGSYAGSPSTTNYAVAVDGAGGTTLNSPASGSNLQLAGATGTATLSAVGSSANIALQTSAAGAFLTYSDSTATSARPVAALGNFTISTVAYSALWLSSSATSPTSANWSLVVDNSVGNTTLASSGTNGATSVYSRGTGNIFLYTNDGSASTAAIMLGANDVAIQLGSNSGNYVFESLLISGRHVTALNQVGSGISATQMPANTGDGVTWVGNAQTSPTASPVGGAILYASSGKLFVYQSDGTNFQIAASGGSSVTWANDLSGSSSSNQYVQSISGNAGGGGTVALNVTTLQWAKGQSSPTISQAAQTTDVATNNLTLAPQGPWASATGSNRNPGSLIVSLSSPASGGSHATMTVSEGGTGRAALGVMVLSAVTYGALWLADFANAPTNANWTLATDLASSSGTTALQGPGTNGGLVMQANGSGNVVLSASTGTIGQSIGGTVQTLFSAGLYQWQPTIASPAFTQATRTTDAATQALTVQAQSAYASSTGSNVNGGALLLQGGAAKANGATGLRGGVRLQVGADTAETLFEVGEVAVGRRFSALNQLGSGLSSSNVASGDGVTWVGNASSAPSSGSPPVGGALLYAVSGALWVLQSDGTQFQIAAGGGGSVTWANDLAGSSNSHQYVAALSGNAGGGGGIALSAAAWLQITPGSDTFKDTSGNVLQWLDVSGNHYLSSGQAGSDIVLYTLNNRAIEWQNNGTLVAKFDSNLHGIIPDAATSSFQIGWDLQNTSGATGANLILYPQFSVNANGTPGSLIAFLGAPSGSGSEAFVTIQRNGTTQLQLGALVGASGAVGALYAGSQAGTPSASNWALQFGNLGTAINGPSRVLFYVGNTEIAGMTSSAASFGVPVGGLSTAFQWAIATQALGGGGTFTLSSAQYSCPMIQPTGTAGSSTLVFPNVEAEWILDMSGVTFGGGHITVQAGGASKTVTFDHLSVVFQKILCDGNGKMYSIAYA